jgi:hypothetical protein
MRRALTLHPDSRCIAATSVEVEIVLPRSGDLVLQYRVRGKISDLRMPSVTASTRADELWRHTCFEAFVCAPPASGYYEFNFAPSTQWAAYRFSGYRTGMSVAREVAAPRLAVQSAGDSYSLQATLALKKLLALPAGEPWRLALSAVIVEANGRKSYWALAHPPGEADFHHLDGFVHELRVMGES